MAETFDFIPASEYKDRHGLFIAVIGDTNSGKSFSALRLAAGIAKAQNKKVAVIDTEGGRILHLKDKFGFDVFMMKPPHRPQRYLAAAQWAEGKGYGCLVFDSYSTEWRGEGGKLDWSREIEDEYVERKRQEAERDNKSFQEWQVRATGKSLGLNEPGQAQKRMELGFLQLRMPIIFAIRGANTFDPGAKAVVFKAQCRQGFLFDVTCSFRLAQEKKGIIDLTDAKTYKMEGDHAAIFKHGEQLSERHGELVNAWASNAPLPDKAAEIADQLIALAEKATTEDALLNCHAGAKEAKQMNALKEKRPELFKRVNDAVAERHRVLTAGDEADAAADGKPADDGQAGLKL